MSSPVVGPYLFFSFPAGPLTPPGRPKNLSNFGFSALFADFYAFQKMTRNLSWKMRPKMRKSWIWGLQNPPKIGQKSVLNRPCQKVVIFKKKYEKNYYFSKRWPLILSPWPVFRKLFYEIAFEAPTKFWLEKTIEKPPKNHPQTKQKSMEKT